MELQTEPNRVLVAGHWWRFSRSLLQARRIDDRVVVLFDYMSFPSHRQAKNLACFDLEQALVWTAEHPTAMTTDTYVNFLADDPLTVWNFAGYKCVIDLASGHLVKAEPTK